MAVDSKFDGSSKITDQDPYKLVVTCTYSFRFSLPYVLAACFKAILYFVKGSACLAFDRVVWWSIHVQKENLVDQTHPEVVKDLKSHSLHPCIPSTRPRVPGPFPCLRFQNRQ